MLKVIICVDDDSRDPKQRSIFELSLFLVKIKKKKKGTKKVVGLSFDQC
jgi:hypothetical protein